MPKRFVQPGERGGRRGAARSEFGHRGGQRVGYVQVAAGVKARRTGLDSPPVSVAVGVVLPGANSLTVRAEVLAT